MTRRFRLALPLGSIAAALLSGCGEGESLPPADAPPPPVAGTPTPAQTAPRPGPPTAAQPRP